MKGKNLDQYLAKRNLAKSLGLSPIQKDQHSIELREFLLDEIENLSVYHLKTHESLSKLSKILKCYFETN